MPIGKIAGITISCRKGYLYAFQLRVAGLEGYGVTDSDSVDAWEKRYRLLSYATYID